MSEGSLVHKNGRSAMAKRLRCVSSPTLQAQSGSSRTFINGPYYCRSEEPHHGPRAEDGGGGRQGQIASFSMNARLQTLPCNAVQIPRVVGEVSSARCLPHTIKARKAHTRTISLANRPEAKRSRRALGFRLRAQNISSSTEAWTLE